MFELKDIPQFLGVSNASYDPNTDTIYECFEGEFAWYHESRHRQQWKDKGKMYGINNLIGTLMLLSLFSLSFGPSMYEQAIISLCIIIYLLPEIDAHWYAIKMKWLR